MKTALKILLGLVLALVLLAGGGLAWASSKTAALLARTVWTGSLRPHSRTTST